MARRSSVRERAGASEQRALALAPVVERGRRLRAPAPTARGGPRAPAPRRAAAPRLAEAREARGRGRRRAASRAPRARRRSAPRRGGGRRPPGHCAWSMPITSPSGWRSTGPPPQPRRSAGTSSCTSSWSSSSLVTRPNTSSSSGGAAGGHAEDAHALPDLRALARGRARSMRTPLGARSSAKIRKSSRSVAARRSRTAGPAPTRAGSQRSTRCFEPPSSKLDLGSPRQIGEREGVRGGDGDRARLAGRRDEEDAAAGPRLRAGDEARLAPRRARRPARAPDGEPSAARERESKQPAASVRGVIAAELTQGAAGLPDAPRAPITCAGGSASCSGDSRWPCALARSLAAGGSAAARAVRCRRRARGAGSLRHGRGRRRPRRRRPRRAGAQGPAREGPRARRRAAARGAARGAGARAW